MITSFNWIRNKWLTCFDMKTWSVGKSRHYELNYSLKGDCCTSTYIQPLTYCIWGDRNIFAYSGHLRISAANAVVCNAPNSTENKPSSNLFINKCHLQYLQRVTLKYVCQTCLTRIFTAHNSSCRKVMFLQAFVCCGGGGVGNITCIMG